MYLGEFALIGCIRPGVPDTRKAQTSERMVQSSNHLGDRRALKTSANITKT